MITNIQQKYDQLTQAQKDIFAGYGLRQVKHFVEVSLPTVEPLLPENSKLIGINSAGKLQAIDSKNHKTYLWISDLQWQEASVALNNIDNKEDFLEIWNIFNLKDYQLIDLSHIHRDFLESLQKENA